MEKTDNNKLIDKFMGIDFDQFKSVSSWEPTRYDESWDKLMPVVEKITNIWATTTNRKLLEECTPTFRAMQNRLGLIEMSGVHDHAVEFIKWYNSQPPRV